MTMISEEAAKKNYAYIEEHKKNVAAGLDWIAENLPEIIQGIGYEAIGEQIHQHDESKFSEEEFDSYAEYFFGLGNKPDEVTDRFEEAWNHHIHNNPHHWNYWVVVDGKDKIYPVRMPYEYIVEMILDWWAFSWKKNNLYEIFQWYRGNKKDMILHPDTEKTVEDILDKMEKRLWGLDGK